MAEPNDTVFGQGQTLFRQGEKGGELFFIKAGQVELSVRSESGEHAVIAVVGEKSVLGTMSFLENDPRSATAKAVTEVKAVVVNQAQREKLLKSIPTWFGVLVKDLSSNLRRTNLEFAQMKAENERLKKRVEALRKKAGESGDEDSEKKAP